MLRTQLCSNEIELATTETSRVIEKCVAVANPKACVSESAAYKNGERLDYKLGVSEEWLETLTQVKDLLSQKSKRNVGSEEALQTLMREFIQKHDPLKQAERRIPREKVPGLVASAPPVKKVKPSAQSLIEPASRKRKPIHRITIHEVTLRDQNQCSFVGTKGRCQEKRWLDFHHVLPVARGGSNDVGNLRILCQAHHRLQHQEK